MLKREENRIAENERRRRDMERRMQPKSNEDFAILYNELDSWRRSEIEKIKVKLALLLKLFSCFKNLCISECW